MKIKIKDETKGIIFIFCIFLVIALVYQRCKNDDIKSNGKLVFVIIEKIGLDQYGRPDIYVNYQYEGKIYGESRSFSNLSYKKCNKYLLGRKVGVVFSTRRHTNIEILLTPLSFKNAGFEMPDSSKVLFEKIRSAW